MKKKIRPLSISEFCAMKKISKSRAYQLTKLKEGALVTEKFGKLTVVPAAEVMRWTYFKGKDDRVKLVRI